MRIALSIVGALAALALGWIIPSRRSSRRVVPIEREEDPSICLVGGGSWIGTSWWPVGAPWPFVIFEVFTWGLRIGPRFRLMKNLPVPTTELAWIDVGKARITRWPSGISLKPRIFRFGRIRFRQGWTGGIYQGVIDELRFHGVPIEGDAPWYPADDALA